MKQKIKRLFTIHYSLFTNNKGFTLVELAIVLIIIGILVALGAALMGPLTKRAKFSESREVVKAAREAIIGYAIERKNLPAAIADTGARSADAWGNLLDYYYSANLSGAGVNLCTTTPTYLTTVVDNRTTPPTTLTNRVVVLLLSRGENGTNEIGSASPFTIQEQSSTYDDIVEYIDIAFLREKVCHALKITTESLPMGMEEVAYPESNLEATDGTTPYTWSIISGSLPVGLTLQNKTSGTCGSTTCTSSTPCGCISGTPTTDGSFNFTVQVTDSELPTTRTAKKSLTITINPNKPVITTEFLHYGTEGVAYSATLSVAGGKSPYSWSLTSGSLPTGLSLSGGGVISGTPPVTTGRGTYSFTVTVTDSLLPVGRPSLPKSLSIAINPAP